VTVTISGDDDPNDPAPTEAPPLVKAVTMPQVGELITNVGTNNTYTIGESIGEGSFGVVYACSDGWGNDLAAKILKPIRSYEEVRAAAMGEIQRLLLLRHPYITYVFDAFEYRDTFYIITERCYCPVSQLFTIPDFDGRVWLRPLARCLLQAVHYLHNNQYAHQDIHINNVFAAFARDEMNEAPGSIQFKLGDLGVSKVFGELDAANTLAEWMRPPEAIEPGEYGPVDHRLDIYHVGLLFLQLAHSRELRFTRDEILAGRPQELALELEPPLNFALEKALRRHVPFRTFSAAELWRDLYSPPGLPADDAGTSAADIEG
jgi:serine/threonine-protein kinase